MKWIGTQTIYDNVRLTKSIYAGDGTGTLSVVAGDITIYNPVNNGDPTILFGSAGGNHLEIQANYASGAQTLESVHFKTASTDSTVHAGQMLFSIDGSTDIFTIRDDGVGIPANFSYNIGGAAIISDSGGTTTLNWIDALDATTAATIESAIDSLPNFTSSSQLTALGNLATVGTIGTGVWQGTAIASAYLDADTAHLSGTQTFSGAKTFTTTATIDVASVQQSPPAKTSGAMLHIDGGSIMDDTTSAEGTLASLAAVVIEAPSINSDNSSITVTDAATLYINNAPSYTGNVTEIANPYALWVDDGTVKFDSHLTVGGTITGNVTGNVTGNASGTAATVTAGTQAAITTCANLTTVGTISTGEWRGNTIASSKTKHVLHYSFKGYAAGLSSGNWQYAEDMADAQFPFQLNSDYGDTIIGDGSLTDVSTWFRSSGIVMPRAATAISMFGWATCGGTTNNISIAICKITPTRNSTGAKTPDVVATITFPALNSNDKMEDFEQTSMTTASIAKGDILMPFVISPYDGSAKTTYFNVTLEVEG